MKSIILKFLALFLFTSVAFTSKGQKYTTIGIVQFEKLDGVNYKKTKAIASMSATWMFNDKTKRFFKAFEGDGGSTDILSIKKEKLRTVYEIQSYGFGYIVIVDANTITTIEGQNQELKSVFRIVKKESLPAD